MSCNHLLAFTSGLALTVINFIIKATGTDFGEIMACRGLLQMPVMFGIIAIEGTDTLSSFPPQVCYFCLNALVFSVFSCSIYSWTFCTLHFPTFFFAQFYYILIYYVLK